MNDPGLHQHIHVLTGKVQGGKTTFITNQIKELRKIGVIVMGMLCPGLITEGRRSEFSLVNIETGHQISMGTEQKKNKWQKYRRFYFNPEAFIKGSEWIKDSLMKSPDLLVIDEVGPMELEGLGWSSTLGSMAKESDITQLWIVRQDIVSEVILKWKIPDDHVYTMLTIEGLFKKWKT